MFTGSLGFSIPFQTKNCVTKDHQYLKLQSASLHSIISKGNRLNIANFENYTVNHRALNRNINMI